MHSTLVAHHQLHLLYRLQAVKNADKVAAQINRIGSAGEQFAFAHAQLARGVVLE